MRLAIMACGLLLSACATLGGGGRESVEFTVPVSPDTALRIAATQLELHGYEMALTERGTLVTRPRDVPQEVRAEAVQQRARRWIVRVEASPLAFTGDTRVRVAGYLLPQPEPSVSGDTIATIPVTADDRELFQELESIGRWIADAARRRRRGQ